MLEFVKRFGVDPASPLVKKENLYALAFGVLTWAKAGNLIPADWNVDAAALSAVQFMLGAIAAVNFLIAAATKGKAPVVRAILAGVLLAAAAGPAVASERLSAGLSAGPALIQRDDGSALAAIPALWVGWSVSDRVTATSTLEAEYSDGWAPSYLWTAGGRLNVERGAVYRLALGAEYVAGLGPLEVDDGARVLLVASAILKRGGDGRPVWSADLRPTLDFESGKATWRLAAKWHAPVGGL